jgi:hypothetical protein
MYLYVLVCSLIIVNGHDHCGGKWRRSKRRALHRVGRDGRRPRRGGGGVAQPGGAADSNAAITTLLGGASQQLQQWRTGMDAAALGGALQAQEKSIAARVEAIVGGMRSEHAQQRAFSSQSDDQPRPGALSSSNIIQTRPGALSSGNITSNTLWQ